MTLSFFRKVTELNVNKNPTDATVADIYLLQSYFLFTLNYDAPNHELKI